MSGLKARLHALGLLATAAELDDLVALATKKRWGPQQIIQHIVDIKEKDRARRGLDRRRARSRLERFKPMADFDWNWPTQIERPLVESVVRLDFIEPIRNVVLVAPQGLGKTMIAQNIAHQAIPAGHGVLFLSAAQLLLDLAAQDAGDLVGATKVLSDAVALAPENPKLHALRGRLLHLRGEWVDAIREFDSALELKPNAPTALFFRGRARAMTNNLSGAIEDFERCIELQPGSADAFAEIGDIKYFQGRLTEAEAAFLGGQ